MNYEEMLAQIALAKRPTTKKVWKAIMEDPDAFIRWHKSRPLSQEQMTEAAFPQLFQALEAKHPSRGDGPIPVSAPIVGADYFEEALDSGSLSLHREDLYAEVILVEDRDA